MCVVYSIKRHRLTSAVSQGADADDFNPGRFIDADGQVTPALADTKDGTSGFGMNSIHSLTTCFPFAEGDRSSLPYIIADLNSELRSMYRSRNLCKLSRIIFPFLL